MPLWSGNLAKTVGDNLVKHGVQLINGISSTECVGSPTPWLSLILSYSFD